ncbi:MAG TPA: hypothetical protein VG184_02340 [Acidimicrobiales bacterium]|jgi:hypothetical protein|nr:hypothetical protein [Acidimicrobiales bacterium]
MRASDDLRPALAAPAGKSRVRVFAAAISSMADRPAAPAALALIGALGVVSFRLLRAAHGDATLFVMAERAFANPAATPHGLTILPKDGYDGQFYYRLALGPLNFSHTAFGITFDNGFRLQRIGYPALAWLVSAGQASLVPEALIAVNVAALTGIAWVGGIFSRDGGRHALWGVVLAGYFGFVFSLARDTAEPLAAAFLVAGILANRRGRPVLTGLLFAGAALTREPALAVPAALALTRLAAMVRRRTGPGRADLAWVLPAVAFAAWQLTVLAATASLPLREDTTSNLSFPFEAMFQALHRNLGNLSIANQATDIWMGEFVVLVVVIAQAIASLRSTEAPAYEKLAFALVVVMAISLSTANWSGLSDLRSLDEVFVLAVLVLLGARRRLYPTLCGLMVVLPWVAAHRALSL